MIAYAWYGIGAADDGKVKMLKTRHDGGDELVGLINPQCVVFKVLKK